MKKSTLSKTRKTNLSKEKKKAWDMFSKYIRLSALTDGEYGKCYTCDKMTHYNLLQAGHWIEGHNNMVYINEAYVRPQCKGCNVFKHGNQGEFRDRIRQELGEETFQYLKDHSRDYKEITLEEYTEIYNHYKRLVEGLL